MPVFHVVSFQTFNQVQYDVHVLNFLIQALASLDHTNILWQVFDLS